MLDRKTQKRAAGGKRASGRVDGLPTDRPTDRPKDRAMVRPDKQTERRTNEQTDGWTKQASKQASKQPMALLSERSEMNALAPTNCVTSTEVATPTRTQSRTLMIDQFSF